METTLWTYEPQNTRTNIRLLRRFLNLPRATVSTLRSDIDRFEAHVAEFEAWGNPNHLMRFFMQY